MVDDLRVALRVRKAGGIVDICWAGMFRLPRVRMIDVSYCDVDDAVLDGVDGCKHLVNITARRTRVRGCFLLRCGPLSTLWTLDLGETSYVDDSASGIVRCENLVNLIVDRTTITDESLRIISGMRRLERVFLDHTGPGVTVAGIRALKTAPAMRFVQVSTDCMTEAQAKALELEFDGRVEISRVQASG